MNNDVVLRWFTRVFAFVVVVLVLAMMWVRQVDGQSLVLGIILGGAMAMVASTIGPNSNKRD